MWGEDDEIYPANHCPACGEKHHIQMSYDSKGVYYRCPKTDMIVYGVYA